MERLESTDGVMMGLLPVDPQPAPYVDLRPKTKVRLSDIRGAGFALENTYVRVHSG